MRDILREGIRNAISKLILMPVSVGFLWLLLVHAQVAQVVGLPTPTSADPSLESMTRTIPASSILLR